MRVTCPKCNHSFTVNDIPEHVIEGYYVLQPKIDNFYYICDICDKEVEQAYVKYDRTLYRENMPYFETLHKKRYYACFECVKKYRLPV